MKASQRMAVICGWASQGLLPAAAVVQASQQQTADTIGGASVDWAWDSRGSGDMGELRRLEPGHLQQREQGGQQQQQEQHISSKQCKTLPAQCGSSSLQGQQQQPKTSKSRSAQGGYDRQESPLQNEVCWDGEREGEHATLQELSLEQLEQELRLLERECLGGFCSSSSCRSGSHITSAAPFGVDDVSSDGCRDSSTAIKRWCVDGGLSKQQLGDYGPGKCLQQQHNDDKDGLGREGWEGGVADPPPWQMQKGSDVAVAAERQSAVQELLARNAQLLQKL